MTLPVWEGWTTLAHLHQWIILPSREYWRSPYAIPTLWRLIKLNLTRLINPFAFLLGKITEMIKRDTGLERKQMKTAGIQYSFYPGNSCSHTERRMPFTKYFDAPNRSILMIWFCQLSQNAQCIQILISLMPYIKLRNAKVGV